MAAHPSASGRTQRIDVRTQPHEDVLQQVERMLGVRLDRSSVVYGSYGTTEGFRTDRDTWVRVARRQRWRLNGSAWVGAEAASVLRGVAKPGWFQCVSWTDAPRDVVWRADEMELIVSPVIEKVSGLGVDTELPDSWWSNLKTSLAALGEHETDRVGMRQAHLSMRINQVFDGQVDTTVDEWVTAHADLHWGNLTTDCHLLDWEDWGGCPARLGRHLSLGIVSALPRAGRPRPAGVRGRPTDSFRQTGPTSAMRQHYPYRRQARNNHSTPETRKRSFQSPASRTSAVITQGG